MERTNKLLCPNCRTPLKSVRGIRIGRKITCPQCQVAFTVRPEDAEKAARVHPGRLGAVVALVLLYLLGGAGLAFWCFANNVPQPAAARAGSPGPEDGETPDPSPSQPPGSPVVSAADQRQIDDAIARGVWFLRKRALPTGTWGETLPMGGKPHVEIGFASLPALTLLECGISADDPLIQKAAAYVREHAPQANASHDTYQRALAVLFLDRLGDKKDEELIQYLALCLIAGQNPNRGAWHYFCPALDSTKTAQLLEQLRDKKRSLADWRKEALEGQEFATRGWDNSNSQFAILALWVAQRHGVPIDRTIARAEKHFRNTQRPSGEDPTGNNLDLDGSWYYNATENSSRWPSMTCAGLLGLAVGHGVSRDGAAEKPQPLSDRAIERALAMLAREIDRPDEKRPPDIYFLWSVERVSVLFNLNTIGGRDWYAWGRKVLLAGQAGDGSWKDVSKDWYRGVPVVDTCFALLFLKQANLARGLKLQLLEKK
jgi:hypothetical protein